jgi:hypothetical protein
MEAAASEMPAWTRRTCSTADQVPAAVGLVLSIPAHCDASVTIFSFKDFQQMRLRPAVDSSRAAAEVTNFSTDTHAVSCCLLLLSSTADRDAPTDIWNNLKTSGGQAGKVGVISRHAQLVQQPIRSLLQLDLSCPSLLILMHL